VNIENSIALVTGANRGLGKAYTDALLAAGAAKIYAAARDPASIAIADPRIAPIKLDVTKDADVNAAAARCADVNLLINNAGIMLASPMLAGDSEAALRAEMEVNVFGMLRMVRAFAPVLARNSGGAIANMLRQQLDVVENSGFSPKVLQFFHSVPIIASEMACLDEGAAAGLGPGERAEYSRSCANRLEAWSADCRSATRAASSAPRSTVFCVSAWKACA